MPQVPCPGCQRTITLEFDDLTKVIECGGCDTRFGPLVRGDFTGGLAEQTSGPSEHMPVAEEVLDAESGEEGIAPRSVAVHTPTDRAAEVLRAQGKDFVPSELAPMPKEPRRKKRPAAPPGLDAQQPSHIPLVLSLGAGLLVVVIVMGTLAILFTTGAFDRRKVAEAPAPAAVTPISPLRGGLPDPPREYERREGAGTQPNREGFAGMPGSKPPVPLRTLRPSGSPPNATGPELTGGALNLPPRLKTGTGIGNDAGKDEFFEDRRSQLPDLRGRPADSDRTQAPGAFPSVPVRPGTPVRPPMPPAARQTLAGQAPGEGLLGGPGTQGWVTLSVPRFRFMAQVPVGAKAETRIISTPSGSASQTTFTSESKTTVTTISVATYESARAGRELPEEKLLRYARRAALKQLGGEVESEEDVSCGEHDGKGVVISVPGRGKVHVRWFLVGRRLFTLAIRGVQGDPPAGVVERFYDRVRFEDDD